MIATYDVEKAKEHLQSIRSELGTEILRRKNKSKPWSYTLEERLEAIEIQIAAFASVVMRLEDLEASVIETQDRINALEDETAVLEMELTNVRVEFATLHGRN
mgnify:CR=1 FL=1